MPNFVVVVNKYCTNNIDRIQVCHQVLTFANGSYILWLSVGQIVYLLVSLSVSKPIFYSSGTLQGTIDLRMMVRHIVN